MFTGKGNRIFDAHFHIIDNRYPLIANRGYLPEPYTVVDYMNEIESRSVVGGVVVSGSFQGYDQNYLLAALKELGTHFVGVTQLPNTVTDAELMTLHSHGVRGLRFNLYRGGSETIDHLARMAQRVYDLLGWHVELYVDSKDLASLKKILLSLPAVSIDHLGLSKSGLSTLLHLADKGIKVKATGFARVDFNVEEAIKSIYQANPNTLMFGTDLPSTRAPRRFEFKDIERIIETLGIDAAERVLYENAIEFYKMSALC